MMSPSKVERKKKHVAALRWTINNGHIYIYIYKVERKKKHFTALRWTIDNGHIYIYIYIYIYISIIQCTLSN